MHNQIDAMTIKVHRETSIVLTMPHNLLDPLVRNCFLSEGVIFLVACSCSLEKGRQEDHRAIEVDTEEKQRVHNARDIETLAKVNSLSAEYNESVRPLISALQELDE